MHGRWYKQKSAENGDGQYGHEHGTVASQSRREHGKGLMGMASHGVQHRSHYCMLHGLMIARYVEEKGVIACRRHV